MRLLRGLSFKELTMMSITSLLLINSSCVNDIEGDENQTQGTIPIQLSAKIEPTLTRVTDDTFEENDMIGLYITVQPSAINKTRYIDNRKFTYNTLNGFVSDEIIFFPEGNNACDFISYYPYNENAIKKKASSMEVSIQANQTDPKLYSASNFMIAKTEGVTPREEAVELEFEKKFSQLNIQLKPQSGYTTEMLLNANPTVKIKNVYSKASYDFVKNEITALSKTADITPHGSWEVSDELLTGKSAILIPQNLAVGTTVELAIGEKIFECTPHEELILKSGTSNDIIFSIVPSADGIKGNISVSLKDWEVTPKKELDIIESPSYIHIPSVDFKTSSVYKVMNNGNQVAEICKEYLLNDNINSQAIVVYPVLDGKTDLSNGLLCALLGKDGLPLTDEVHGGKVCWNHENDQLIYEPGDLAAINYIYVSKDNRITTTRTENTLQLQLQADRLTDIRGDESFIYPIVKIATQYWTRGNMKTQYYMNGKAMDQKDNFSNISAGYATPNKAYFFYNSASIATGLLAPQDWKISSTSDWNKLKAYLKDNTSELRSGNSWGNDIAVTNLSGFNASAVGVFHENYKNDSPCVCYWSLKDSNPNAVDKLVKISALNNKIEDITLAETIGASIRCVRK